MGSPVGDLFDATGTAAMTLAVHPLWALICAVCLMTLAGFFTPRTINADVSRLQKLLLLASHWLAALSLWLLLCQPMRATPPDREVLLVTPGGSLPTGRQSAVVSLEGFDLHPLHQQAPEANTLTVLGHGLPLSQWRGTTAQLTLRPPPLPLGLIDVNWSQRMVEGDTLLFSARVNDMPEVSEALLLAPGGDVIQQSPVKPDGDFSLTVIPPSPGPLTLAIALVDKAGQILRQQPLPVVVEPAKGPKVLLSLARLSFEARDLQRWLAQTTSGLQLSAPVGTQVKRNLSVANAPAENVWQSDAQSLNLMVTDTTWLNQRNAVEAGQLAKAVAEGMGLLVLADESALQVSDGPLLDAFGLRSAQPKTVELLIDDQSISLDRIGVMATAGEPLLASAGATSALALARRLGGGRVVLSLIGNSYTLNTRGQGSQYASLWQSLVGLAARPLPASHWLDAPLPIMRHGESVKLCQSGLCSRRKLTSVGWNSFDGQWQYAFSDQYWQAYRAQELQRQTALAAALRGSTPTSLQRFSHWPPRWLLWAIFLFSSGWIWLRQKFQ